MNKPPIEDLPRLLEEAEHTLRERQAFYPRMVEAGKIKPAEATRRIEDMQRIVQVLTLASETVHQQQTEDLISYQGEVMLANWSETAAAGRKVEFWLPEGADAPDEHPFKHYSRRVRGSAGTLFQMVLVEIDSEGEPMPRVTHEKRPSVPRIAQGGHLVGGPISKHAGMLCKDSDFHQWLYQIGAWDEPIADPHEAEAAAAEWVRKECGVESRRLLDHEREAQLNYENKVAGPFARFEAAGCQ